MQFCRLAPMLLPRRNDQVALAPRDALRLADGAVEERLAGGAEDVAGAERPLLAGRRAFRPRPLGIVLLAAFKRMDETTAVPTSSRNLGDINRTRPSASTAPILRGVFNFLASPPLTLAGPRRCDPRGPGEPLGLLFPIVAVSPQTIRQGVG